MNLCFFGIPWAAVGDVEAILGLCLGVLGTTWVHLGAILGMLGLCWVVLGPFRASSPIYSSNIKNTDLIEMLKSLSLGPCQAGNATKQKKIDVIGH